MLSIIDLLKDNTLNTEMAGFIMHHMINNSSFLTAANPNSAGKTTLMGAMLNLIKPGIKIKTVDNDFGFSNNKNVKYLAHEIGSGPYYSYIWGEKAQKFFSFTQRTSIASCMHADTIKEMETILFSEVGIKQEHFHNLDLVLFMRKQGNFGNIKRRVSHIFKSNSKEHKLIFKWNKDRNGFEQVGEIRSKKLGRYENFLQDLIDKNIVKLENVRKELLKGF